MSEAWHLTSVRCAPAAGAGAARAEAAKLRADVQVKGGLLRMFPARFRCKSGANSKYNPLSTMQTHESTRPKRAGIVKVDASTEASMSKRKLGAM